MQALSLDGVTKRFGAVTAVDGVDLAIPEGQLVCFLGPSGCGKTTLLRLIAGLEQPSAGRIRLGDDDITHLPAHRRNLGMVFQSLALFPHLDVAENIAYSLRIAGQGRAARRARAEELLDLVRLPGMGARHISQLSGGQRQRVAIARALALEPKLFLLDEPLSALDAKLREEMQIELRLLQQRVNVTTILVTHDQREAMTMADMVAVMDEGRIQQLGTPLEIYRRPANAFVAEFIGTSNLLSAEVVNESRVTVKGHELRASRMPDGLSAGAPVTLSVRPEDVRLLPGEQEGENRLTGEIEFVRDVGQSVELYVDCAGTRIMSHMTPRERPEVGRGDLVTVELPAAACVVLDR
ncbi:MAG: ABC transporter ATP-binding protein [Gammaproteobacteria bacterium]|nr:ABC transporter ATP-binding protein [Gammaproteobacteria bacterium]